MGFNPIELERGSTGYKIWKKIKIKRVRVPDILCLNTGLRFESRGKTKLEISMSHSLQDPKRAWDAGMRDDDFVSIVAFDQGENSPLELTQISPVHFVEVGDMRTAFSQQQTAITKPKGVEEVSEIRVRWISALANKESIVTSIEPSKIVLISLIEGKKQTIQLSRNKGLISLKPQVNVNDTVQVNQIIASVVPIYTTLTCPTTVGEGHFLNKLTSVNLSERYAAAKALRYRGFSNAEKSLQSRVEDDEEDIYVQLEAAAALAAYDYPKGWDFIEEKLHSSVLTVPLETQLETVIVTSEIPKGKSESLLIEVLQDKNRDDELRAGAAWALGQFVSTSAALALVDTFDASPLDVKVEAARALLKIGEPQISYLVELLQTENPAKRDGISWALARIGNFDPNTIINGADDDLRRWISYIVGYGRDNFSSTNIESICQADSEVYFAASVLWQILSSWVNELGEY